MLNLNYNIIGAGGYDRYSKEEAKGFIPFQVQYLIVAGGGGSAGGDNNLKAGQAGGGAQVVTGSYCVSPFNTYAVTIGQGGNGGQRSATFPNYTGSNGETSSFAEFVALGGNGGYIQNVVTQSFFAGSGSGAAPIAGNGGIGSEWTYNLSTSSFPPYPPFAHAGEYISESYYGGGGAGFMVNPPVIEYIVVGGGGGAGGSYIFGGNGVGGNGGWGGMITTGSFTAYPDEIYTMYIGSGGLGAPGPNQSGSFGSGSYISGSDTINPHYYYAAPGSGGLKHEGSPVGGGSFTTQSQQPTPQGANGYRWVDGFFYGGGGGGSQTTPPGNGLGGLGNGGEGGFPYNLAGQLGGGGPWANGRTNGAGGGAGGLEPDFAPPYMNPSASKGGDGVIRLRYLGSPIATGGIIQTSGSYTYHTFISSADFTIALDPLLIYPGLPGTGGGGVTASNATPNTGGGAGASFYFDSGSKGGSGFVAIRYEGEPIAEGGQVVITDHYTYHVYTASGQFYAIGNETNPNINPCDSQTLVDYILIAGGGGGGRCPFSPGTAGGGGAGGYITGSFILENSVATNVVIGAGGKGADGPVSPISGVVIGSGSAGQNSSILNLFGATAIGGGGGGFSGNPSEPSAVGGNGGSGGGNGGIGGGLGFPPQGNDGNGGGGGGALNASTSSFGGLGITWLDGITYSQGGSGNVLIAPGQLNAGWGGQGNKALGVGSPNYAQNGASGSAIFRYVGTPKASGGTITQTGGYTYHTFTSSGLFDPIP